MAAQLPHSIDDVAIMRCNVERRRYVRAPTGNLSNLSMMDDASLEVLECMKDVVIYLMRSANMITLHGGRLKQR